MRIVANPNVRVRILPRHGRRACVPPSKVGFGSQDLRAKLTKEEERIQGRLHTLGCLRFVNLIIPGAAICGSLIGLPVHGAVALLLIPLVLIVHIPLTWGTSFWVRYLTLRGIDPASRQTAKKLVAFYGLGLMRLNAQMMWKRNRGKIDTQVLEEFLKHGEDLGEKIVHAIASKDPQALEGIWQTCQQIQAYVRSLGTPAR